MARRARLLEEWVSAAQVAAMLNVTASRVGQLRREQRLPATRTRLGYLYHRGDVNRYLAARSRQGSLDV